MKICKNCQKEFNKKPSDSQKYWSKKMFCSSRCSGTFNNSAQKLIGIKRPLEVVEKLKPTMFKKGQIAVNKGKPNFKIRGENHWAWKGNKAGYRAKHDWAVKAFGQPKKCENCKKTFEGKGIHWANKSDKYNRIKSDWIRLCASCHKKYDNQKKKNK